MKSKNNKKHIHKKKESTESTNTVVITPKNGGLLDRMKSWANEDFFVATLCVATTSVENIHSILEQKNELDKHLLQQSDHKPDLLIITGHINNKHLKLIQNEYRLLAGDKYVITIGSDIHNKLEFNPYNLVSSLEDIIPVDYHIPGYLLTNEKFNSVLRQLKSLRKESAI